MSTSSAEPSGTSLVFDSPAQELYLNLWRTYDCLKGIEEELFARQHLSPQQYNVLRVLRSVYPASLPTLKLGRAMISRSPDITRMLDRLAKRALIERLRTAANRRVVQVKLTEQGRNLLDELQDSVRQMHEAQLGHLTELQRSQLLGLLRQARFPHEDGTCAWLSE